MSEGIFSIVDILLTATGRCLLFTFLLISNMVVLIAPRCATADTLCVRQQRTLFKLICEARKKRHRLWRLRTETIKRWIAVGSCCRLRSQIGAVKVSGVYDLNEPWDSASWAAVDINAVLRTVDFKVKVRANAKMRRIFFINLRQGDMTHMLSSGWYNKLMKHLGIIARQWITG